MRKKLLAIAGILYGSAVIAIPQAIGQQILYATHFETGLDPKLMVQAPSTESMRVIATPQGSALKVTIHSTDDYSRVANKIVFNANGTVNAWPDDDASYLKIGIYKWWWQNHPSAVTERTMYFGDVRIAER